MVTEHSIQWEDSSSFQNQAVKHNTTCEDTVVFVRIYNTSVAKKPLFFEGDLHSGRFTWEHFKTHPGLTFIYLTTLYYAHGDFWGWWLEWLKGLHTQEDLGGGKWFPTV